MPLRVITRADTGTLWIVGTVTPAGAKVGVRVRRRAGSDNEKLAREEAATIEASVLRDFHHGAKPGTRSFAAACSAYLTHQERSDGTIAVVKRLLLHWRETSLAGITQEAVDESRAKLLRPGAGDATWRKTLAILSAVMNHAARRGWCAEPNFDLPPISAGRTAFLLPEQYEALEAAAAPHLRPLLRYLICTGSRLGEALDLEWSQVDLVAGRIVVWADQTKGDRARVVNMPPAAIAALAAMSGERSGAVFRTARATAYRSSDGYGGQIKTAWNRACRLASASGFTPHDLRHSFATWHYALNRDLLALKEAGGWSDVAMVARYAHLLPVGQEAAIKRVWGTDAPLRKVAG